MSPLADEFVLALIADELYRFGCDLVFFEWKFVGNLALSHLLPRCVELLQGHHEFMLEVPVCLTLPVVFLWLLVV